MGKDHSPLDSLGFLHSQQTGRELQPSPAR